MNNRTHSKQYTASASPYEVDLRLMGAAVESMLVFDIADFDVEVVGNAATVTMTGTGPFGNSAAVALTDGTFAIAGGKRKIESFALGKITFTSASVPFNVNICRRVKV
jgi:hypothetical protein